MQTSKVSKGQVAIPKEIRESLGIKPGDTVVFSVEFQRKMGWIGLKGGVGEMNAGRSGRLRACPDTSVYSK